MPGFIRSNGDVGITALDPAAGATEEITLHPELEIDANLMISC